MFPYLGRGLREFMLFYTKQSCFVVSCFYSYLFHPSRLFHFQHRNLYVTYLEIRRTVNRMEIQFLNELAC